VPTAPRVGSLELTRLRTVSQVNDLQQRAAAPLLDVYEEPRTDAAATRLGDEVADLLSSFSDGSADLVGGALQLARRWGAELSEPGAGATRQLWQALACVAAVDLTVTRVLEPHLDALAILAQARTHGHTVLDTGAEPTPPTWGVFAAEGPGMRVQAAAQPGDSWRLDGRKPWCSLASRLDRALVTAWCGQQRGLFAIDLHSAGVQVHDGGWVSRGLTAVTSEPIDLDGVEATAVGPPQWYANRPGFAWGGMGVAACWWGGAAGIVRRMARQAGSREADQVGQLHLGAADASLHAAGATLALAADAVDRGVADGAGGAALALRVRRTVRVAAEEVLERAGHAMGPGPLVSEADHAARIADLQLYLRQEHAERDEAALGRMLLADPAAPSTWAGG